jgi:hypothetical protein
VDHQYRQYALSLFGYHLSIKLSEAYGDILAAAGCKAFFSDIAPDQCDGLLVCTMIQEQFDIPTSVNASLPDKGFDNFPVLHHAFLREMAADSGPEVQTLIEATRLVFLEPDTLTMRAYSCGWTVQDNYQAFDFFMFLFAACLLARHQGILLHACGLVVDGLACAITGPSGAGKSTAGALIKKDFLLADDIVGITGIADKDSRIQAHASPLSSSRITDGPGQAPLAAIFFPVKADGFIIEPMTPRAAFLKYLEEHAHYIGRLIKPYKAVYFELAHALFQKVPAYALHFPVDYIDTDEIRSVMAKTPAPVIR